jgi:hypothetical protein
LPAAPDGVGGTANCAPPPAVGCETTGTAAGTC